MKFQISSVIPAAIANCLGSLEKRLIGALLLIIACTGVLQFISQERAYQVREESQALGQATRNAEHAEQLVRAVVQFRATANQHLSAMDEPGSQTAVDPLIDAATQIGQQVNALRMGGMDLYALSGNMAVLDDMDRHVDAIIAAPDPAYQAALERRNSEIAVTAHTIEAAAAGQREAAVLQLSHATRTWHLWISVVGSITFAVVLVILFDLVTNILPALRRMHHSLRRLAEGDLEVEVETFRLQELRALAGSLETFRRNAQAVQNLAFTDPSTGMPNRRAFLERSTAMLNKRKEKETAEGAVVILADVDRFKDVNDDYGHAAGDQLVRLIGERIAEHLDDRAIVARVGGDEFAICAPLEAGQPGSALGSALVSAMRSPFDLGGFSVAVSVSLGLVDAADGDEGIATLLNRADLALYASKNGGRNQATCFTTDLEEERELDRALERDLADAFQHGQLRLVYQPIHAITGQETEVEALVRWDHPRMGEISPARFIPAAERSGLMIQLGEWIVRQALVDLAGWPDMTMSINLSPVQLQQDGFSGFLLDCCRKHGISPRRIILEVTESLSIERNTRALLTLKLLRNAGFRIALDDFGTGYSSLCMMKTFKFDRLKLDRSLISDLGVDATSDAVFDAAVTMALRVGAEIVAEGVSAEYLVEPVRRAGCTHVQGFHYSRPIEARAVSKYFEDCAPNADLPADPAHERHAA